MSLSHTSHRGCELCPLQEKPFFYSFIYTKTPSVQVDRTTDEQVVAGVHALPIDRFKNQNRNAFHVIWRHACAAQGRAGAFWVGS